MKLNKIKNQLLVATILTSSVFSIANADSNKFKLGLFVGFGTNLTSEGSVEIKSSLVPDATSSTSTSSGVSSDNLTSSTKNSDFLTTKQNAINDAVNNERSLIKKHYNDTSSTEKKNSNIAVDVDLKETEKLQNTLDTIKNKLNDNSKNKNLNLENQTNASNSNEVVNIASQNTAPVSNTEQQTTQVIEKNNITENKIGDVKNETKTNLSTTSQDTGAQANTVVLNNSTATKVTTTAANNTAVTNSTTSSTTPTTPDTTTPQVTATAVNNEAATSDAITIKAAVEALNKIKYTHDVTYQKVYLNAEYAVSEFETGNLSIFAGIGVKFEQITLKAKTKLEDKYTSVLKSNSLFEGTEVKGSSFGIGGHIGLIGNFNISDAMMLSAGAGVDMSHKTSQDKLTNKDKFEIAPIFLMQAKIKASDSMCFGIGLDVSLQNAREYTLENKATTESASTKTESTTTSTTATTKTTSAATDYTKFKFDSSIKFGLAISAEYAF